MEFALARNDLADLVIEDMRRWQDWDLTPSVLALFGKKGFDAPIMRRAIVRYALSCPRDEAKRLIADLKTKDPQLIDEIQETLDFEKKPIK